MGVLSACWPLVGLTDEGYGAPGFGNSRFGRGMALKSMTGFGRADGRRAAHSDAGALAWVWEVRSVNGRGLDVRLRVPPGYDALELKVRAAVGKSCVRGSVNITLTVKREGGVEVVRLNTAVVDEVMKISETLRARVGGAAVSVETLLATRGVLEFGDGLQTEALTEVDAAQMLASLEIALHGLVVSRAEEGARLNAVLADNLREIERLVGVVNASPARMPAAIEQRLREQITRLTGADGSAFDAARLHQEAVLLATRADVEEELQRLRAHVYAARDMLGSGDVIGRKLDFLTQEFNREANTLCSKSNDGEITRAGLALKTVIDQMREQVQNIE
jgi:uncharacterized protein (TIGR00255 family)